MTDLLKLTAPKCKGCGRIIVSVIEVTRKGKYGQLYRYARLRHHDARKKGHRAYCYVPIREEGK